MSAAPAFTQPGPGGTWAFLDPRHGRHHWHVRCPLCCTGRMPLLPRLDGGYGLADRCHPARCSPIAAARHLARLVRVGQAELLVDPDDSPLAVVEVERAMQRDMAAACAWAEGDAPRLIEELDALAVAPGAILGAALRLYSRGPARQARMLAA